MTNWKEIHPDFTEELQKEWENYKEKLLIEIEEIIEILGDAIVDYRQGISKDNEEKNERKNLLIREIRERMKTDQLQKKLKLKEFQVQLPPTQFLAFLEQK